MQGGALSAQRGVIWLTDGLKGKSHLENRLANSQNRGSGFLAQNPGEVGVSEAPYAREPGRSFGDHMKDLILQFFQAKSFPELAAAVRARAAVTLTRWETAVKEILPTADELTHT